MANFKSLFDITVVTYEELPNGKFKFITADNKGFTIAVEEQESHELAKEITAKLQEIIDKWDAQIYPKSNEFIQTLTSAPTTSPTLALEG